MAAITVVTLLLTREPEGKARVSMARSNPEPDPDPASSASARRRCCAIPSLVAARPACWPGPSAWPWPTPASRRAGGRLGVASFSLRPGPRHRPGLAVGPEAELVHAGRDGRRAAPSTCCGRPGWRWKPGRPALSCWRPAIISPARIQGLVSDYNRSAREYLSPLGCVGANPLFAMLTQRQMMRTGLRRKTTARCAWRSGNGRPGIRMPPIASP